MWYSVQEIRLPIQTPSIVTSNRVVILLQYADHKKILVGGFHCICILYYFNISGDGSDEGRASKY
jgi:hypothetical protein